MAEAGDAQSLLQSINRHFNCLTEENRNTRKRAIEGIRKELSNKKERIEPDVLHSVLAEVIKPVLKLFSDPVEKCREVSVIFLTENFRQISEPHVFLSYTVPVLVQRLGQPEIVEPSEELRLLLVELLSTLIEVCTSGKHLSAYLDDMVKILQRTIIDPYPEVKKQSCKCAGELAKSTKGHFHMQSETLIKPLLLSIAHQHSRVRVEVINAIGLVLQYGNGKNVDDVVSHLAQRLFDQAPTVRRAVITVVGGWLLDLLDRYSFHHKLIPLLLTGITDEVPDIAEQADALWHDVGLKYAAEQEEDLKDKKNWTTETLSHYPPNIERPNLGCRELVYRNFSKILSGLLRDLHDWVAPTRVKSAQLLYTLVLNDEQNVTQHLEKLLSGLYRACGDEEQVVIDYVTRTAEILGWFVPPDTWVKMVLEQVKLLQSPGTLRVLAAMIRGSQATTLRPYLQDITNMLSSPDISALADSAQQMELLSCIQAIVSLSQEDCAAVSTDIFKILITVLALHRHEDIPNKVSGLLEALAQVQGLNGSQALFDQHTKEVIAGLKEDYSAWTQHSVERLVFDTLVLQSGPVVGELLDDVLPVMAANLHPDKDPELRLKFFTLLSRLLLRAPDTLDSQHHFPEFAVSVVRDMVLPNCVWRAGRTASAIHTTAISCLWALLQSGVLTQEKLMEVMEDLMTQLRSTLEDDNKDTRLITCRAMMHIFRQVGNSLEQDRLHNMYPDLLKRLDDASDDVRVAVCHTFTAYINCFEDRYNASLYQAHLEAMYRGLLVHLDDPESRIQEAVLGVLKTMARLNPIQLLNEVDAVRLKHRTTTYLDQLTQHTRTLVVNDGTS